jgi:hypothetical protein
MGRYVRYSVRMSEPMPPIIAVLAVFALHVFLLYVAHRARAAVFDRDAPRDHALTWVRLDRRDSAAPAINRRDRAADHVDDPQAVSRPLETTDSQDPSATTPLPPSPPNPINWRANAVRSAQVVVKESVQERHRSFGAREKLNLTAKAPESVFGPPPKHKQGEVGEDTYGDPALWLNDNCYQELDKSVQTARDVFTIVPMVKCVMAMGRREANGKLFEHLKKREEPPVPDAGTELNELPERAEEGGTLQK